MTKRQLRTIYAALGDAINDRDSFADALTYHGKPMRGYTKLRKKTLRQVRTLERTTMTRRTRRINQLLRIIRDAKMTPVYEPSPEPENVDDTINIGNSHTHIQVCAFSGDPVMVSSERQTELGNMVFVTDPVEHVREVVPLIRKHLQLPAIVKSSRT